MPDDLFAAHYRIPSPSGDEAEARGALPSPSGEEAEAGGHLSGSARCVACRGRGLLDLLPARPVARRRRGTRPSGTDEGAPAQVRRPRRHVPPSSGHPSGGFAQFPESNAAGSWTPRAAAGPIATIPAASA